MKRIVNVLEYYLHGLLSLLLLTGKNPKMDE